jgi:hypothetical protein
MGDLIQGTLPGMMRVGLAALWLAAFAGMGSEAAAEPLLDATRGLFARGRHNPPISRQLGIRALSRRNWADAVQHFDRVLEAHPRFARIHQLRRFAACMTDPGRAASGECSLTQDEAR